MTTESALPSDNTMHEALEKLWKKYSAQFHADDTARYLYDMLRKGMVWAENDSSTEILVTGINPSFRKGYHKRSFGFKYRKVTDHDSYYSEIKTKLLGDRLNEKAGYLDLFAIRETLQKRISAFIRHPIGLSFLAEHLAVTQKEIERLHPRLIIVKNKGSWIFWGINAQHHGHKRTNVWMGYTFDTVPGYEKDKPHLQVRRITGLLDDADRIGNLRESCLIGTVVLFTSHLRYLKKEDRPTIEMVTQLFDYASSLGHTVAVPCAGSSTTTPSPATDCISLSCGE